VTSSGRVVLALIAASATACTTAYHARELSVVSDSAAAREVIAHCLQSIGLEEISGNGPGSDPMWKTPDRSFWSTTPGCLATVRLQSSHWNVDFVPGSGSISDGAEVLSNAFKDCVEMHAPGTAIHVEPERFLDLR
jgi:hypothetical protein